jgi:hypothetical protein
MSAAGAKTWRSDDQGDHFFRQRRCGAKSFESFAHHMPSAMISQINIWVTKNSPSTLAFDSRGGEQCFTKATCRSVRRRLARIEA